MVASMPRMTSADITTSQQDVPFNVLRINGGLLIRLRENEGPRPSMRTLTARELDVLALVAEGYANKEVGEALGITERTVKNHLNDIFTKLNASDRTHAVVTAVRQGLLAI